MQNKRESQIRLEVGSEIKSVRGRLMGSRASPRDRRYGLKGSIARIKDRQDLLRYSKVSLMCAVRVSRIRVSRRRIKEPGGRLNQRASSIE